MRSLIVLFSSPDSCAGVRGKSNDKFNKTSDLIREMFWIEDMVGDWLVPTLSRVKRH
jgi:hypothetical protein